jgi:hypothetical protein
MSPNQLESYIQEQIQLRNTSLLPSIDTPENINYAFISNVPETFTNIEPARSTTINNPKYYYLHHPETNQVIQVVDYSDPINPIYHTLTNKIILSIKFTNYSF